MIFLNDKNVLVYNFDTVKIDISTLYENREFFAKCPNVSKFKL